MAKKPGRMRKGTAAFVAATLAFIGGWEGLSLVAYKDVVGVLTICYGETKNVRAGYRMTKAECDTQLLKSVIAHEDGMMKCLRRDVPEGAHLAFLSLTYNVGVGAFCGSTVARRANAGDIKGACEALMAWNKGRINGRLVPISGLTNRRTAEREICLKGLKV